MDERPETDACDTLERLRSGVVTECKLVPWGSNYTFAVALARDGDDDHLLAIYKPRAGEAPLWDFPSGTLYQREYAAYLLADVLGWDFIPPTVIRDGPHGIGTVQLYVEPEHDSHYFSFREQHQDELRRMAVFDLVSNNADRKGGHVLAMRGGHRYGVDHGVTFHVEHKLRTVLWGWLGEPLTADEVAVVDRLATEARGTLGDALAAHLTDPEIEAFVHRCRRLADRAVMPSPAGEWPAIPWPPF